MDREGRARVIGEEPLAGVGAGVAAAAREDLQRAPGRGEVIDRVVVHDPEPQLEPAQAPLMVDRITPAQRSANMSRIGSKHTRPEMAVRRVLFQAGFRYRLHVRELPGSPDIVLPRLKTAIQVRGCFWHGHSCNRGKVPASNTAFWLPKLERNKQRDAEQVRALRKLGWRVLLVWECETKCLDHLRKRLVRWLSAGGLSQRQTKP